MSPDTPALRGLLSAITAALDVPTAALADDDWEAARLLSLRAQSVRAALSPLATGVLDHTAIQSAAHTLTSVTGDLAAPQAPGCPHSHDDAPFSAQCAAQAAGADDELLCWLPKDHDGPHWDSIDRTHWVASPVMEMRCPDGAS